jgi:5-methyltetrahydrofolate corrinoid/iron sulfur protein methyltransferase
MEIIGERINGMFKDIREAIINKDKEAVQHWAKKQTDNGAAWLDVNTGASTEDKKAAMVWLIETIQEVVKTPIALDSTDYDVIEAGLEVCKNPAMINSCHADRYKIERVFPMAKKYNAKIIGLAMNEESGIPKNADARIALAMELVAACDEYEIPFEDLYIDPLVLPVNVAQDHGMEVMETLRQVQMLSDPAPNTVVGLSNSSQRCNNRELINRTMLAMLMANGLTAAIADADDDELMATAAAARVILNKDIYCDSFVEQYKTSKM